VKKVLYNQVDYHCILSANFDVSEIKHKHWSELKFTEDKKISNFTIKMEGEKWDIIWPNREGEIFSASGVYDKIKKFNAPNGLTITYPSTASCRTLIFLEESENGLALLAPPDINGRVTEFRINADDNRNVYININGENSIWYTLYFKSLEELEEKAKNLQNTVPWSGLSAVKTDSKWQVQVGFIGPDGKSEVPENKGFDILVDISELMLRELGKNNILHVFGYSSGHDMDYPDYTPSNQLGGSSKLKKAVQKIHQNNQKVVFYINGRIAQKENVERDGLNNSILTDNRGIPITEIYHERDFFVMNPSSEKWQNRLLSEAIKLKELGADGIQLDQLGGRAAPVPVGEIWGKGYINLINNLHNEELTVWIQGLSDIYPADWFELTNRKINILEDGTIRGGTPLGKADKRVYQISVPNQVILVPLSKLETKMGTNMDTKNKNIIIDLDLGDEELFLYKSSYMTQLEKLIHKAVLN
jgi:Domain of unknown function (DUF6259)